MTTEQIIIPNVTMGACENASGFWLPVGVVDGTTVIPNLSKAVDEILLKKGYGPPEPLPEKKCYDETTQTPYKPRDLTPGDELGELIPALMEYSQKCPACVREGSEKDVVVESLYSLIQHLNDGHAWERDAIADWLETLDVDLSFQPAQKGD